MDLLPVGDFSFYDHILDTIAMLGAVPERFEWDGKSMSLETYFHMARGHAEKGIPAMEMTKWFDSNYHYIVPELTADMRFSKSSSRLLNETRTVRNLGHSPKPVLIGPITFLMLAKSVDGCNRWDYLDKITDVYCDVIAELDAQCTWIQIDEPILCTDLTDEARKAFQFAYSKLKGAAISSRLLLTTYFGELDDNLDLALSLPVDGLHIDLVRGPKQIDEVLPKLPSHMTLSLGLVDGRNVWKTELETAHDQGGDAAVRRKGIDIARQQIKDLISLGAPGIHLYTLNNADICLDILGDLPELDG